MPIPIPITDRLPILMPRPRPVSNLWYMCVPIDGGDVTTSPPPPGPVANVFGNEFNALLANLPEPEYQETNGRTRTWVQKRCDH